MQGIFLTEPEVELTASSVFHNDAAARISKHFDVEWVELDGSEAAKPAAFSGKTNYLSMDNKKGTTTSDYLKNIIKRWHFSVLAHSQLQFAITTSRCIGREFLRHSVGLDWHGDHAANITKNEFSFGEVSQRYVKYKEPRFYIPYFYQHIDQTNPQLNFIDGYKQRCLNNWAEYESSIELSNEIINTQVDLSSLSFEDKNYYKKVIQGASRNELKESCETLLVITGSVWAWLHIIEQRSAIDADIEFRRIAYKLYLKLQEIVPEEVQHFAVEYDKYFGFPYITTQNRKV